MPVLLCLDQKYICLLCVGSEETESMNTDPTISAWVITRKEMPFTKMKLSR